MELGTEAADQRGTVSVRPSPARVLQTMMTIGRFTIGRFGVLSVQPHGTRTSIDSSGDGAEIERDMNTRIASEVEIPVCGAHEDCRTQKVANGRGYHALPDIIADTDGRADKDAHGDEEHVGDDVVQCKRDECLGSYWYV